MNFDLWTILLAVNLMLTASLWRRVGNRPRPKKKYWRALVFGNNPIKPKHAPPKELPENLTDNERRFFTDFAWFGKVVNWTFANEDMGSNWRLQEIPDTDMRLSHLMDGPDPGRRYEVFYNQERMGNLEIGPGSDYSDTTPNVRTYIDLYSARLLPYEVVVGFLGDIAQHVTRSDDPTSRDYFTVAHAITRAAVKTLWDSQRITGDADLEGLDMGDIELEFHGTASRWYFDRREALARRNPPEVASSL